MIDQSAEQVEPTIQVLTRSAGRVSNTSSRFPFGAIHTLPTPDPSSPTYRIDPFEKHHVRRALCHAASTTGDLPTRTTISLEPFPLRVSRKNPQTRHTKRDLCDQDEERDRLEMNIENEPEMIPKDEEVATGKGEKRDRHRVKSKRKIKGKGKGKGKVKAKGKSGHKCAFILHSRRVKCMSYSQSIFRSE